MSKLFRWLFLVWILSGCIIQRPSPVKFSSTPPISTLPYEKTTLTTEERGLQNLEDNLSSDKSRQSQMDVPFVITEFILQEGTPKMMANFTHPEAGCSWMGVGGQIFDTFGLPLNGYVVKLIGFLDNKQIVFIALAGGALNLGPGGYEFKISDHPFTSENNFQITIFDKKGMQVSQPVKFDTKQDCDKNFVLINFVQKTHIQNGLKIFLPLIFSNIN